MRPWVSVPVDWRRPEVGGAYEIVWCDHCDFGSLAPRPSADEISAFYEVAEYYTHQSEHHDNNADRKLVNRLRVHLAWQFEHGVELDASWFRSRFGASGARFCDIGCGAGGLLEIIKRAGHEAIGVDPDPEARHLANQNGLTVVEGTAESLPRSIANERFDAVFLTHTLEHCLDPMRAIRNALSLTNKDGFVVVETPNNSATAYQVYGSCWLHLDVPRHLNFFTEQSLRLACVQAGGEVIDVEFRGYTRQFLGDIIRQQEQIWKRFSAKRNGTSVANGTMREPTTGRAWQLLLRTAFADEKRKYDSVRTIVRKGAGPVEAHANSHGAGAAGVERNREPGVGVSG
jgi:2-polyprenyl-3-methyl-5-hydroxy-6-metoxy-1,4-benzoquinol methylase